MTTFGAGPQLAAQCPRAPTPDGWRSWTDADGPIPDAISARAQTLATDQTVPPGATESYPLPGVTTLLRVEPREWSRDAGGNLIEGCFRVGAVYLPAATTAGGGVVPPKTSSLSTWVGVLTIVSLAVGTIATVATWKKK